MEPFGSALIVVDPDSRITPAAQPARRPPSRIVEIGQAGWSLRLESTVGPPRTIERTTALVDWATLDDLKTVTGRGHYATTFDGEGLGFSGKARPTRPSRSISVA